MQLRLNLVIFRYRLTSEIVHGKLQIEFMLIISSICVVMNAGWAHLDTVVLSRFFLPHLKAEGAEMVLSCNFDW